MESLPLSLVVAGVVGDEELEGLVGVFFLPELVVVVDEVANEIGVRRVAREMKPPLTLVCQDCKGTWDPSEDFVVVGDT